MATLRNRKNRIKKEVEKGQNTIIIVFSLAMFIIICVSVFFSIRDKRNKKDISQEQLNESFKTIEKFYKIEKIDEDILILKRKK